MREDLIKELDKILPVVVRVHGEHHPELAKVEELYAALKTHPTEEVFAELRTVTSHYTAPEDACPTFCKVYEDLQALDSK